MHEAATICPNPIARYLKKPPEDFTKQDLVKFIEDREIHMLNFRYVGGDGRLKTLNFAPNSRKQLDRILSRGERVDGSSLFNWIPTVASDLYVIPRYRTAFVNPFTDIPTIDILCSYYTREGEPLECAPENIVRKAHHALQEATGYSFEAAGELEYYLFSEIDRIYPIIEQKGYHESHPFSKWGAIRREAMHIINQIGGDIKYGHAEVGNILHDNWEMVQHEIEFRPVSVENAADQLVLAKWAVREVAYKYGLEVSFAPKIIVGHAGSGLHIHMRLVKDGRNMLLDAAGLNDTARSLIGGLLRLAPSLTAFGNTVPTSFLRLVPHQEAPTKICWGDRNRSMLIRVPLGWQGVPDMVADANPKETPAPSADVHPQTVELRSPDGSANVHQLLAGLAVAARCGLQDAAMLETARGCYVEADAAHIADCDQLPNSCWEAAAKLAADRTDYQARGVFPAYMIDYILCELRSHEDHELSEKLYGNADALREIVKASLHCG